MTDQLFEIAPKLTERQSFIWEYMRDCQLDASAAGVLLHVHFNKGCGCGLGRSCEWSASSGREVLLALHAKGLLKRDRHHVYRRADGATSEPDASVYDPSTAAFPEGF